MSIACKDRDKSIEYLKEVGFPFVIIGRPEYPEGMLWVDNDNFQTTYNLVNELIKKGYKDIAFLGAKKEWNVIKDRFKGFKAACQINGMPIQDKNFVIMSEFNEKEGIDGTVKLLENITPTAIIVEDDILAFGTLKVLHERNIKNIEVIGFNNNPLSEFQMPPLSSIDINAAELGYYAAKTLIDFLENNQIQRNHYIIESKIIKRESFK